MANGSLIKPMQERIRDFGEDEWMEVVVGWGGGAINDAKMPNMYTYFTFLLD